MKIKSKPGLFIVLILVVLALIYALLNQEVWSQVTQKPTATPTSTQESATPGPNIITLIGETDKRYAPTVPDHTLIDATRWKSAAVGPKPDGDIAIGANVRGRNGAEGGSHITWRGGIIVGSLPMEWDWETAHDFGGGGVYIHNDGPIEWQYLRVHNVEDGIRVREKPEYSNTGSWVLRDCYFTAIRDDAVENDRFEPGVVQDCLFDGVHVFISEQDETVGNNTPIGLNEDDTIYVKRVYARLYGINGTDGPGRWFKWLGDVPHHQLVISDSVFAIGSEPRLGWSKQEIPDEVSWVGENYILWLGEPGMYGGPKPDGVIFLEGKAASDKWVEVRNKWLREHHLPEQDFPADYNPYDAPLMQIPILFPSLAK